LAAAPSPPSCWSPCAHAGVCRTDLHVTEGGPPRYTVNRVDPRPRGGGGRVCRGWAPTRVTSSRWGTGAGIAWLRHTCGVCKYCRRGNEKPVSPIPVTTGLGRRRWLRPKFATVPAAFAHHLPDGYSEKASWRRLFVRRHHRISLAAARRATIRRPASVLYGFGGSAQHHPAQVRAGPMRRRGARDDPRRPPPRRVGAGTRRRVGPRCRRPAAGAAWTPRSCSPPIGDLVLPAAWRALDRGGNPGDRRDPPERYSDPQLPAVHLFPGAPDLLRSHRTTRADARAFLDFAARHHIEVTTPEYPLGQADRAAGATLSAGPASAGAAVLLV